MITDDHRYMQLALSLAKRGLGNTWPNPSVGAVIVKNGRILGRGWTQPFGRPHGEPVALDQAGSAAKGATLYVTLEPCAHQGQTPPCAKTIVSAGIARVVSATSDPNPLVNGKGYAILRDAGIEVVEGVCRNEADALNAGFFKTLNENRPYVTLKLALSVDGKIATRIGDSQWITGPEARQFVHYLRATHDGVMVGSGTSIADDPSLDVRGFGQLARQPVRIVLDSQLRSDPNGILGRAEASDVWFFHGPKADTAPWSGSGATLIKCALNGDHLDIEQVLGSLAKRGVTRLFCEGGGTLAASLLGAGCVDELVIMTGGIAIGREGLDGLGAVGADILNDCPKMTLSETRPLGQDVMTRWVRS